MPNINIILLLLLCLNFAKAQHNPKSWVIGLSTLTSIENPSKIGGTVQFNYAQNCFTTFANELSVFPIADQTALELTSSVNSIINNFKKNNFILTGGLGVSYTMVALTKEGLQESLFAISSTDNQNHLSILLKIQGLYAFRPRWNFITSLNFKTLGSSFINVSLGINYEL